MKKEAWHLGSDVHNVLTMRHRGGWHVFGNEHAHISFGVRLQILHQIERLITIHPTIMVFETKTLGG